MPELISMDFALMRGFRYMRALIGRCGVDNTADLVLMVTVPLSEEVTEEPFHRMTGGADA